jgi:hypothetical protein
MPKIMAACTVSLSNFHWLSFHGNPFCASPHWGRHNGLQSCSMSSGKPHPCAFSIYSTTCPMRSGLPVTMVILFSRKCVMQELRSCHYRQVRFLIVEVVRAVHVTPHRPFFHLSIHLNECAPSRNQRLACLWYLRAHCFSRTAQKDSNVVHFE